MSRRRRRSRPNALRKLCFTPPKPVHIANSSRNLSPCERHRARNERHKFAGWQLEFDTASLHLISSLRTEVARRWCANLLQIRADSPFAWTQWHVLVCCWPDWERSARDKLLPCLIKDCLSRPAQSLLVKGREAGDARVRRAGHSRRVERNRFKGENLWWWPSGQRAASGRPAAAARERERGGDEPRPLARGQ